MAPNADPVLLMISAMYENGGNTTQRLLDGHPELVSYPFESQLGTKYVQDYLSSVYPLKYRWPSFLLHASPSEHYEAIIDEECRVRIKTPNSSKFRDTPIDFKDDDRRARFLEYAARGPMTRGALVEAFFRASSDAWQDRQRSASERVFVGYSPVVGVDADKIVADHPGFYVLNVVRHPCAAYGDTKRRPVPLSIAHYTTGWVLLQQHVLAFAQRFPDRIFIVRFEDLIEDPQGVLGGVLHKIGIAPAPTLAEPSWNGRPMQQLYPWGTIRRPTAEEQRRALDAVSPEEQAQIRAATSSLLGSFGYA